MRLPVYGAGNIGSLYAVRLAQSSQDVAILARGTRLEQIRRQGIELEDGVSGQRTTTSPEVVARLDPDDMTSCWSSCPSTGPRRCYPC